MMVMALVLRHGRPVLPFLMAGIVAADLIFITLGLAGVAALQEVAPRLYWALRFGSLLYVAYLAYKLWTSKPADAESGAAVQAAGRLGRLQFTGFAFLTTISNPKGLLFVFGVFPNFIVDDGSFDVSYAAILIATFLTLSLTVSGTWGLLAGFAFADLAKWRHLGKLSAVMIVLAVAWVWMVSLA